MKSVIKNLQNIGIFTSGLVAHHYGSKLLDLKESLEENKLQAERDAKLDEIATGVKKLTDNCGNIESNKNHINESNMDKFHQLLNKATDKGKNVLDSLDKYSSNSDSVNKDSLHKEVRDMVSVTDKINNLLEEVRKGNGGKGNNLMPSAKDLYSYLDNLSLLEEGALLHILLFCIIMLTVFNIFVILFSNEIIKYFNLEDRYPSLYNLLLLRYKLQRYYLMWNIFILFILCMGGVCINILVIYSLN